jgi:hypothetical protein
MLVDIGFEFALSNVSSADAEATAAASPLIALIEATASPFRVFTEAHASPLSVLIGTYEMVIFDAAEASAEALADASRFSLSPST